MKLKELVIAGSLIGFSAAYAQGTLDAYDRAETNQALIEDEKDPDESLLEEKKGPPRKTLGQRHYYEQEQRQENEDLDFQNPSAINPVTGAVNKEGGAELKDSAPSEK